MRNLFLALLLANLAFAAWHTWFAAAPAGRRPAQASAAPGIKLVSEVKERDSLATLPPSAAAPVLHAEHDVPDSAPVRNGGAPAVLRESSERASSDSPTEPEILAADVAASTGSAAASDAASSDAPAESAAGRRCVSVGPFSDESEANAAAAKLSESGYDPTPRLEESGGLGYWVYIERIATRAEGDEILAVLRENGVTDSYMIRGDGRDGNLISLGVFSDADRAGRLRDQVRTLGYEPVVADRSRAVVYWLDVALDAERELDVPQSSGRITRIVPRPCARQ